EIDPFAAQWLRNLIDAGHIAPGIVDERSIEDVTPSDLRGFTQCHFFAGIGVWSYALRRAGWRDDQPVWTGSCPCQPFSEAGKGNGFADERHLWPAWQWLIEQCRPAAVFGEQAASKNAEPWIELVSSDLEGMGFAFGALAFPSAGVGAPHIRDRTYFVAYANDAERWPEEPGRDQRNRAPTEWDESDGDAWERLHGADWRAFAASFCASPNAHTSRMGRLRAYGNAINAEAATEFIRAATGKRQHANDN
ncbi:DNA cytosine methyltransferase, partial [Klebsiella pneumoniae]|uniref:DNA cytosine methyltransferase n=1 Tax=Klebsiella pneumoniae TaxID=573 RepID=UPI001E5CEA0C